MPRAARARAKYLVTGVLLPMFILATVIYMRTTFDHHAWEFQWDLWMAFVVVISMQLGWNLRVYWRDRRCYGLD